MPPAGRKGSAKKLNAAAAGPGPPPVNKNWEAALVRAQFEEDTWRACVSLLVGRSQQEEEKLISPLVLAVQKPQRKLFTLISWDITLVKIHELGNPKARKNNDFPMFSEVTEFAKVLLDAGKEVPCDLMAKLLKFQLLQIKTNDQQRREAEQLKTEGQKEKVSIPTDNRAKGPAKKGKGPTSDLEASKEKKTKLKSRDDVEPPAFIDDEPEDGPQHYILLVGFNQPQLIWMLDAIGVHVASVIKLCSAQTQASVEKQELSSCEETEPSPKASSVLDAELSLKAKRLDEFWTELRPVLDSGPPDSKLHDVVLLSYTVPDLTLPLQTKHPEAELELGTRIFEGVASLIYDCLDWRRQHQHYCDHVTLLTVPSVDGVDSQPVQVVPSVPQTPRSKKKSVKEQVPPEQETKLPPLSVDVDMCYYNNLLDLVPPESCSVPLILHCMLEQVGISTEQSLSSLSQTLEEPKPFGRPWLDQDLVGCLLQSFLPLINTEEEKNQLFSIFLPAVQEEDRKRLLETFEGANPQKKPRVIRLHDERALRLRDARVVHGFNPAEVELSMMRFSRVWDLIKSVVEQRNGASCWMAVKQQLQHFCTEDMVSWSDVERLLDQSVFEAMTLSAVDQQGVFVNDVHHQAALEAAHVIPWDDPLSYAKQQLHNPQTKGPTFLTEDPGNTEQFIEEVCNQMDLSDLQSCRRRSLFDWNYSERHSPAVFPQVLMAASEEYRCLDTFRGSHKNILYVFCHNPMNLHRQSKEFWDVALHTDVKFRKYLEHVADSISDWTKEEELKREAMIRNQSPAESPQEEDATCSVMEEKTLEPFIRKDSIKAWMLEQERLKEEETTKRSKKEIAPRAKQQKDEATDKKKNKTLPNDKKIRTDTAASNVPTGVNITAASTGNNSKEPQVPEEPEKRFTGYSMNGRLISLSGRIQNLYPSDGGHITVENIDYVEGSSLMKVAVKKDRHCFYTHINRVAVDLSGPPSQTLDKINILSKECREPEAVVKKRVKQGSFSAVLDNKIHLSYSFYGPTGELKVSPEENPKCPSAVGSTGTDLESSRRQTQFSQGCEDQSVLPSGPFNGLRLSVPNGLLVQFLREDTEGQSEEVTGVSPQERGVLVKQSFPLHVKEQVRLLQDASLSKELCRIITSQGAVIRYMRDGSTEVLFADGSVSFSQDSGPVWVPDAEADKNKGQTSETEAEPQKGCWQTTSPSGDRICTIGSSHKRLPTTSLLTFKATDPITHQVMLSREDLVILVRNPDGSLIVEHADGTRITSFLQDRTFTGEKPEGVGSASQFPLIQSGSSERSVHRNDEQIVFPENAKKSEKGSPSVMERAVLVEKEGCASVVMYPERHAVLVSLADGTVITGNNRAEYEVFPSSVGVLQIQSDGKCTYSSDPPVAPNPGHQPGLYTMSHSDKVACDVTDNDRNHFQVMEDGQISVLCSSPAASILTHNEEEEEDKKRAGMSHCPRLFLVHKDGSGTELLSSHTVEEMLDREYSDPTIAVLKEPLPDKQDEFGITILKPSHHSLWSQWLLRKQNPDITPPNLRNRHWNDFPAVEKKSPGPLFGSDTGVGLALRERSCGPAAHHQRVQSSPEVLELRELCQHRPFTTQLQNIIDSHLKEYIESLMAREQQSDEMKAKEPRTEQESAHARDLLNLILSFAEEDESSHTADARISVDVAGLYSRAVGASYEQSDVSEDTDMDADSLDGSQHFTSRKNLKWSERLAQHRQELSEEKTCREFLRKKIVVPYFHPENLPLYQSLLHSQIPNAGRRSMDLPFIQQSDGTEAAVKDSPQESTPQPLNQTPSQSESCAAEINKMPEKGPTKLTLQSAGESRRRSSVMRCKSVQVDVTGKPRRTKVRLPTCILGSKTYSVPNQHFLTVEEPVRRKCRTVSLTDPSAVVRGFQLHPSSADFGTMQEGTSSTVTVIMKNVGVDTCRFRVKQPSATTGLRVIYNPGPVPAGLHVELHVQLFAMCEVESSKFISQDIIIDTETDILYLPVTAAFLRDYVRRSKPARTEREAPRSSGLTVGQKITPMSRHPSDQSSGKTGKLWHISPEQSSIKIHTI